MTGDQATDQALTHSLFEALHPLLRQLNAERTISPGKIGVLRHLAERGRATTSELAVVVRVSPQGISLAVRELLGLGLVERAPDAEDRRRVWIEITPAGRQKLALESSAGQGWLDRAVAERLSPDERTSLAAAIPALRKLGTEPADD
ncbi:MarR family transcriptional regulator [Pseudarthrobacter sp. H3Y2-7]|uniref:MarR family winged helix-turn-helix transcriptional regulator n=1 Tax=Pseudarthrobacter TaxID=1742993 RepID=UPI0023B07FA5|nr:MULTISPECIES: MarR family transcriptional regulator [unclassified Pseudarthrobacter]MDE8668184.1 MarR family transcriptional regulator [Pseudarthrobacter sp. H3Y2-7]